MELTTFIRSPIHNFLDLFSIPLGTRNRDEEKTVRKSTLHELVHSQKGTVGPLSVLGDRNEIQSITGIM